jgi:hypothetical protein
MAAHKIKSFQCEEEDNGSLLKYWIGMLLKKMTSLDNFLNTNQDPQHFRMTPRANGTRFGVKVR